MNYLNLARPSEPPPDDISRDSHAHTPPESYDLNFILGAIPHLRTDKVELRPFIPSLHAQIYCDNIHSIPGISNLLTLPLDNLGDTLYWAEKKIRRNQCAMIFTIFVNPSSLPKLPPNASSLVPENDTTASPGTEKWLLAGTYSLWAMSPTDCSAETGLLLFPWSHRSGIATDAVALVIQWAMSMPPTGLGLRRLQWTTQPSNLAAQGLARKLGFQYEGLIRCLDVYRPGQRLDGYAGRKGDAAEGRESRDCWFSAITYVDWEEGGLRERIEGLLGS